MTAKAVRILQISDLHMRSFAGTTPLSFCTQRLVGGANLVFNRAREYPRRVIEALFRDIEAQRPDHLIVSGDLSNLSLDSEFARARSYLAALALPKSEITIVPGNHDIYTYGSAWRGSFDRAFRSFFDESQGVNGLCDGNRYPFVRFRNGIAIIALNSACPSPPMMAYGTLGRRQRRAAEGILSDSSLQGMFRLVVLHHPPHSYHERRHARLRDRSQFAALLRRTGAELVVHGHLHRQCRLNLSGPDGVPIPVIGVNSSTWLSPDPERWARYQIYEFGQRESPTRPRELLEIRTRRYEPREDVFVEDCNCPPSRADARDTILADAPG